jgi:hypothetical protein
MKANVSIITPVLYIFFIQPVLANNYALFMVVCIKKKNSSCFNGINMYIFFIHFPAQHIVDRVIITIFQYDRNYLINLMKLA